VTAPESLPDGALVRVVAATVHGRTLVLPPARDGRGWLVGFHGYAQGANVMLELLRRVPGADTWRLVAIQALHPFYNKYNQIGASWMTPQDREHAIEDNVAYVDAVLAALAAESGAPERLVVCGFSQGVAMAYRAGLRCAPAADAIVAVAGDVPPEFRERAPRPWPRVRIVTGTKDTWFTPERLRADEAALRAQGADVDATTFEGPHEWTAGVDAAVGQVLAGL